MRFEDAMDMIETKESGFMVNFEVREGSILRSDYFPDKHAGEELIKTEDEAWELAERFAKAVDASVYVNIYVINHTFHPVQGYDAKKLNRLR